MTRTTSTSTAPACPPPASNGGVDASGSSSIDSSRMIGRRQRRRLAQVGTLALLAAPFLLGSCCHAFLVPSGVATGSQSLARRRHHGWAGTALGAGAGEGASALGSGSRLRMAPLYAKGAKASSAASTAATGGGRGRRRAAAAEEQEDEEDDGSMLLGSQDEQGGDVDALILGSGEGDGAGSDDAGGVPVMLGTQSAAAAAALKEATADPGVAGGGEVAGVVAGAEASEEEVDIASAPLPAAPTKRRGGRGNKRASAYPEQDYSVKTVDDVCRATINVISSGDEADLQMLTPFVERLLTRYGDHVEILHRSYVPDDKPGLRLLEIWFEGFETFRLYSRYQFTKRGKQGDLTPEVIDEMCSKIDYAMYLDATGDFGPL